MQSKIFGLKIKINLKLTVKEAKKAELNWGRWSMAPSLPTPSLPG